MFRGVRARIGDSLCNRRCLDRPPQLLQKREPARFGSRTWGRGPRGFFPQPLQKRAPAGFSWPHDGHVTVPPPARPAPRGVERR
jgi:hypothetical protein